jgi:sugar (pentulose or hexulose) kinase
MPLLLGIDLGTSYFKVGLFDATGALRGLGRVPVPKVAPAPGRSELAVEDFWAALRRGLVEALNEAKAQPSDIAGISYSSQATTFLLLDRAARPLTPLIMWIDSRGEPLERADREFAEREEFQRTVGYAGLSGHSAAAKWRWFQRHESALWQQTEYILTIADYFTFALTGERVGDASTAAFLGIYDLVNGQWWPEALRAFSIHATKLARPLRPGSACGKTNARAAELLGVPAGIPMAVGGLDHHVAAIGSGLGTLADVSISTGTVLAALVLVPRPEPLAQCYHGLHADGRQYYRLSFDPAGAGQLEDYRTLRAPELTVAELLDRAAQPEATPHGRAVRDILEKVCVTHRDLIRAVLPGQKPAAVLATGGGSRSELWLQITADTLETRVVTSAAPERACLGAAAFAAVAAGLHKSLPLALTAMVRPGPQYLPKSLAP